MARRTSFPSLVCVWALAFCGLVTAQVVFLPGQAPARDSGAPPTERRIPVGTSTISGTVLTAETGRPIRGARVSVNGQTPTAVQPPSAPLPGRGGLPVPQGVVAGVGRGAGVSRSAVTDANGEFSFPRLPAGQYQVAINHNQFLQLNYGQRRFGGQGTYISLAEGQHFIAKASMQRGGAITGTVRSPEGEPIQSAQVRAWRYARANGFRRLQTQGFAQTDDRGMYRLFSLPPGDYLISATPNFDSMSSYNAQVEQVERAVVTGQVLPPTIPGGPPTVSVPIPQPGPSSSMNMQPQYLPTFAPGSPAPSGATAVTVAAGEERSGVDVLTMLVQATTVQVELVSPLEAGVTVQMQLISDDPTTDAQEMGQMRPDQSGRVLFRGVRPGKYTVAAQTAPAPPQMTIINGVAQPPMQPTPALKDEQKLWGRAQIDVDGAPLLQVNLSLQPAKKVSGLVVFDVKQPPDLARARVTVSLSPAPSPQPVYFSGSMPPAQVGPDGHFSLQGVSPGRYLVRASGAGGTLRSAMAGGVETLDFFLDVPGDRDVSNMLLTMTDAITELSGVLTDTVGKPSPDYTIVLVSTDSRYWLPGSRRIVMTRPGPDGQYTFRGLPAGQYFLAAVIDPEQGMQYDPEFLKELAGAAITITINQGAKTTQDVRVK